MAFFTPLIWTLLKIKYELAQALIQLHTIRPVGKQEPRNSCISVTPMINNWSRSSTLTATSLSGRLQHNGVINYQQDVFSFSICTERAKQKKQYLNMKFHFYLQIKIIQIKIIDSNSICCPQLLYSVWQAASSGHEVIWRQLTPLQLFKPVRHWASF